MLVTKPVLHGDNGATLKATTVLAMLHWLGIARSCSRLRVSEGCAFVEALFRAAKYRLGFRPTASPVSTRRSIRRPASATRAAGAAPRVTGCRSAPSR